MPLRIGVTSGFSINRREDGTEAPRLKLDIRFCDMIRRAGGEPAVIIPTEDRDLLLRELEDLDAVVFSGADDVPPERYGAKCHPATELILPRRVASDFCVAELADERELPVLAVCAGIQQWNVHRGGTLHQHLPDRGFAPDVVHRDPQRKSFLKHRIRLAEGSLARRIAGTEWLTVNSWHHQGIDRIGRNLVPTAWSDDGLVEAVEDPRRRFCLGVQWHPEDMPDDPVQQRLFDALVEAANH